MAQPTIANLYGTGSMYLTASATNTGKGLFIPESVLTAIGVDATSTPSAVTLAAALDAINHAWLSTNTDAAVMISSDYNAVAPVTRNSIQKTQHQYTKRHFRSYAAPTFDPDESN